MSAPRQQPAPSLGYQDGQQQDFLHRRKPPEQQEQITTEQQRFDQRQQQQQLEHQQQLLQQHIQHQQQLHHQQQLLFLQQQQQLASMGCKEAHYFGSSATGSTGQGRGGYSSAYIGPRPINPGLPFDSSGGSGNSSCAEGKATAENSAGGSGQSRLTRKSTAEDWFNTFNRDVRGNQSYPNYDNDSPYYVPNHHLNKKKHQQGTRHPRPAKSHHGGFPDRSVQKSFRGDHISAQLLESAEESNSESFRSVIDDLTIKNQKLKKRLRRLEGLHGHSNQAADRLFEVRVHDLPESKKAELERILQKFTASIDNENRGQRGSSAGIDFNLGTRSSAIDSGYASVSRSGNDSSAPQSSKRDDSRIWPASSQSNSELAKMKLVVRKLEQLFTGGEAVVGDLCVMQQQDISNLAAAEEHEAKVLAGEQIDCEGAREASLMSPPHNINNNNGNRYSTDSESRESPSGGEEPEEQRPTRPIDLDPQREQVAEINIEYLTHMTESSTKGLAEGSGWVYLNLIINLAQLHTINVTPPFIKKAIAAASNRLELSSDGNMVRWRVGGLDAPNSWNSGSVSGTGGSGSCEQSPQTSSGRKTVDQFESVNGSGSMPANHGTTKAHGGAEHGFHYKPIFARSQSFEDDSSSCDTTTDTDPDRAKRSSSGESRGTNIKDQGPIIFYKGGGFCTDLSSQPLREEDEAMGNYSQPIRYVRASSRPLGSTSHNPPPPSTKYESPLFRQGTAFSDADVMQIDRDDPGVLDFSPQFTAISPDSHAPPFEFEASGIGGVQPADNFAINCQTRHYLLSDNHGRLPVSRSRALKPSLQKKLLHRIPKAAIEVFYDQDENMTGLSAASSESTGFKKQRGRRLLHHEVLSAKTLKLPPSSLPPASYIFASLSEDSSSYCETDDDAPRSSGSEDYFFHQTAISSSEDSDIMAANFTRRSPSSVATAGDGSRASSVFMGEDGDENEDEEDEDEEEEEEETEDSGEGADLFEDPLSMDESSSTGSSSRVLPPPPLAAIRPSLKRSRGSVISASSIPARKNARVGAGSGSDES